MDVTQFIKDMASDLLEYQKYDTGTTSFLYRQAWRAAQRIDNRYQWTHQITSSTITVTTGSLGPYSLPSDFRGMLRPERLTPRYTYDKETVPIIPDGDYQQMYNVYWKRADNKLYFDLAPESGNYTFYYRKLFTVLTDLSAWPQRIEPALSEFTKYYVLNKSKDTRQDALDALTLAKEELREIWVSERKGMTMQETREPRDILGDAYAMYWINGEDW